MGLNFMGPWDRPPPVGKLCYKKGLVILGLMIKSTLEFARYTPLGTIQRLIYFIRSFFSINRSRAVLRYINVN
jgi:hypothetical protein